MLFLQAAAPLGWVKQTAAKYSGAVLRMVTSTGGAGGGSADPASQHYHTTSAAALSVANLAYHNHYIPWGIQHIGWRMVWTHGSSQGVPYLNSATGYAGGNTTHTHGATSWSAAPKYVNSIVCIKS